MPRDCVKLGDLVGINLGVVCEYKSTSMRALVYRASLVCVSVLFLHTQTHKFYSVFSTSLKTKLQRLSSVFTQVPQYLLLQPLNKK
jgi:hypothetical protein